MGNHGLRWSAVSTGEFCYYCQQIYSTRSKRNRFANNAGDCMVLNFCSRQADRNLESALPYFLDALDYFLQILGFYYQIPQHSFELSSHGNFPRRSLRIKHELPRCGKTDIDSLEYNGELLTPYEGRSSQQQRVRELYAYWRCG